MQREAAVHIIVIFIKSFDRFFKKEVWIIIKISVKLKREIRNMEIEKAKEIVSLLANGINLLSGEIYPQNSIYNNPLIKMSISTVLSALDNTKKRTKN